MKTGFVYLVGSGPGDPELLTEKAKKAIETADCIIYDFLANDRIIQNADCEKIYVGKKGSSHTLSQEEINSLIVTKAMEKKNVVRLKGGDPFIFGRGGEEAEELVKAGIGFCIIPGISSFYSAPAYAGIPLTHRDYANSFEVVTGHRRADSDKPEDINFPEFNIDKTFAFLMGMKNLEYIAQKLIDEKNFPENIPAAIITWGTFPRQRVATGELKNIARIASEQNMSSPAIIIVGRVVLLRDKLRWFDNLPLFGKKIVVTRTRSQASVLCQKLTQLGADVLEFPTIEIKPRNEQKELKDALKNISDFHWIVFTSQNAVEIFFKTLSECGMDARSLSKNSIAAIGPASGKEIEKYFIKPDLIPGEFVAEELVKEMQKAGIKGKNILLPCAAEARETLMEGLKASGADVKRIHIYDTIIPENISEKSLSEAKQADIITFTSSSTAKNFFKIIDETNALLACIGPITADTVEKLGYKPEIIAREYTIDGLVKIIVDSFKH